MADIPKFEATQNLPDFSYAAYAASLGLRGIRLERPDEIGAAWDRALAKSFMKAVLSGDPGSGEMIKQGFLGRLQELLPIAADERAFVCGIRAIYGAYPAHAASRWAGARRA